MFGGLEEAAGRKKPVKQQHQAAVASGTCRDGASPISRAPATRSCRQRTR